ncbi:uncharacterized protein PAC_11593 [Phialocephala subalpina]|uniref:Uncharacterized protein n=1 Tax=Phialocephala subalpina TaxID=576137 RepID=A0A1L7X9M8_9HELO|nr:uncharacterized protein PAC_11593 [Phialocephala subalpina]
MTLQIGASGGLQALQLGLNELASAIVVGKEIGSLFTRQDDAGLFKVFEENFHVKVKKLPKWLETIDFSRRTLIHGQDMRQHKSFRAMTNVRIDTLEGVASLLVLCSHDVLQGMTPGVVESLLVGTFSPIVDPGTLQGERFPHAMKKLLEIFITATVDSDRYSEQFGQAVRWKSEILMILDTPDFPPVSSQRAYQSHLNFLRELLGASTREEMSSHTTDLSASDTAMIGYPPSRDIKIYDTLFLDTAFIALAAAANGARVMLEVHKRTGVYRIPEPVSNDFGDALIVRLWLIQPPEYVSKVLEYIETNQRTYMDSLSRNNSIETYENVTIFGGELELSTAIAGKLGYKAHSSELDQERVVQTLWKKGFDLGISLRWHILPQLGEQSMNLQLCYENTELPPVSKQVLFLLSSVSMRSNVDTIPSMRKLSRERALIVDEVYRLKQYDDTPEDPEFQKALQLVSIAIVVGTLHNLTHAPAGDAFQYAFNIENIEHPDGPFLILLDKFIGHINHQELIRAAASLWGGATKASQDFKIEDERVVGIVAPHSTILLTLIRDPLGFAATAAPLLTMIRGSVPMLPRNPRNGFVIAAGPMETYGDFARREFRCNPSESWPDEEGEPLPGDIVITIEPDVGNDSRRIVLCSYFEGQLVFELDPVLVFENLIRWRFYVDSDIHVTVYNGINRERSGPRPMSETDLLTLKHFKAVDGTAYFWARNPAWLISVVGCVENHRASIYLGAKTDSRNFTEVEDGEVVIQFC